MTAIGTPPPITREDLDPRRGECVVCYVDRLLARGDCTGSLALVRWWRGLRAPRASALEERLGRAGVRCDCELLSVGFEEVATLGGCRAGLWDRPRCTQVRSGSTKACSLWRERPRWG